MTGKSTFIVASESNSKRDHELRALIDLAQKYPEATSSRQKKLLSSLSGLGTIRQNFIVGRSIKKPDAAKLKDDIPLNILVASILNMKAHKLERAVHNHRTIKGCENAMGKILEGFLSIILRKSGWLWSSGHLFEKTDFVRENNGKLERLQVKNRSNTENAAAKKGRGEVVKWHRFNPASGTENWEALYAFGVTNVAIMNAREEFQDFVRQISMRLTSKKD